MKPVTVTPTAEKAAPTRGVLGNLSAAAFLTVLASQNVSGTLYLSREEVGTLLTLPGLENPGGPGGEPHAHTDFGVADGATFDLKATGAAFSLWLHPDADLPLVPSRYPGLGPLWALPTLSERALLSTAETELFGLVARLKADAFTGALVLETPLTASSDPALSRSLLLFQAGGLGGAVHIEGERVQTGAAALRALVQVQTALTLHTLPEPVVAGFLGWLLGLQLSDTASQGVPEGFSGLELTSEAARYYRAGSAYLQVPRPAGTSSDPASLGLFAACQRAPSLTLPTEPHGWEARRYGLTLRGRDALNLMTELAMRFRSDFSLTEKRVLETFRRELSVQAVAETLNLELGDLREPLERLEQGGFIRTASSAADDRAVGDVSPMFRLQPR